MTTLLPLGSEWMHVTIKKVHRRRKAKRNRLFGHHCGLAHGHGAIAAAAGEGDAPRRVRSNCVMVKRSGFRHRSFQEMAIAIGLVNAARLQDVGDLKSLGYAWHQLKMILVRMTEDQMVDPRQVGSRRADIGNNPVFIAAVEIVLTTGVVKKRKAPRQTPRARCRRR